MTRRTTFVGWAAILCALTVLAGSCGADTTADNPSTAASASRGAAPTGSVAASPAPTVAPTIPASVVWTAPFPGKGGAHYVSDAVAVDAQDNVFVTDTVHSRIVRLDPSGHAVAHWGSKGHGGGQFEFLLPYEPQNVPLLIGSVAVDGEAHVYVADPGNFRVQEFDADGRFIRAIGSKGQGPGQFSRPIAVAVDSAGYLYVTDDRSSVANILRFDPNGRFVAAYANVGPDVGNAGVSGTGETYVPNWDSHYPYDSLIYRFSANGTATGTFGDSGALVLQGPVATAIGPTGLVFVVDGETGAIDAFEADGTPIGAVTGPDPSAALVFDPTNLAVDGHGDLFVFDGKTLALVKIHPVLP
jgi:tripartite motif-containing protein 71